MYVSSKFSNICISFQLEKENKSLKDEVLQKREKVLASEKKIVSMSQDLTEVCIVSALTPNLCRPQPHRYNTHICIYRHLVQQNSEKSSFSRINCVQYAFHRVGFKVFRLLNYLRLQNTFDINFGKISIARFVLNLSR